MSSALQAPLVSIPAGQARLEGMLELPPTPAGIVVFSHGSGSGRHSPRNQFVAAELRRAGLGTLLLDLLTAREDQDYETRFDIRLLTERLAHAVRYLRGAAEARALPVGLFGASTGAASALRVAAAMPEVVRAVVSRGGRPDLAGEQALGKVKAATLLIVGGEDSVVIELNRAARYALAHCERELVLVPGATHLFEEPGTLEEVARLAADWFVRHLHSGAGPAAFDVGQAPRAGGDYAGRMEIPLQVSFHGIQHSDALYNAIREKARGLDRYYNHVMSCRVVLELAGRHHHQGKEFVARIDLKVPGGEIVVTHQHDEDPLVAVHDAFDAARRRLEDYARAQRGDVKRHTAK